MARAKKSSPAEGEMADLLSPATPTPTPDLTLRAGTSRAPEVEEAGVPHLLEYTPFGSLDKWRVEHFELLVAEFGLPSDSNYEKSMAWVHQVAEGYSRGWLIVRRLFGIAPLIPRADAHPDDMRAHTRAEICQALGIEKDDVQAELQAVRAMVLAERDKMPEPEAPVKAKETLPFEEDVLEAFGFSERMFEVVTWDPIAKVEGPRPSAENRLERAWFAGRVKEWAKMLREPMASTLARRALMNDLELRRFDDEMSRMSPTTSKYQSMRETRASVENQFLRQLKELQDMFPEMNIAGKLSFQAVMSDLIKAYREYKARGDTKLIDKIRTAAEIEVEMRQSVQASEPRYRLGLNMVIVEAMHGLYDPDFRSKFRPATLRKLDLGFKRGVEEVRAASNEKLVDLEKGVMPGEGDEYPDIPEELE